MLKGADLPWPAWPFLLAAAILTALAALLKPLTDVFAKGLASRAEDKISQQGHARE